MRLKIWTLLLAVLLAAPAFAQYGGVPGITTPPPATELVAGTIPALSGPISWTHTDGALANFAMSGSGTGQLNYMIQNGSFAGFLNITGAAAGLTAQDNNTGAGAGVLFDHTLAATMSFTNAVDGASIAATADGIDLDPNTDGDASGVVRIGNFMEDRILIDPIARGASSENFTITTVDITTPRTVTFPDATGNVTLNGQLSHSVVDSGDGSAAVYSLVVTPGVSVATLDCLDADGCEVTLSETAAIPGQRLVILCTGATAGATTLKHSAGVVNLYNSVDRALALGDAIEVVYIASTWSQIGNYDSAP